MHDWHDWPWIRTRIAPLGHRDELMARVGHSDLGGPPFFGVSRDDGLEVLTSRISRRSQRRIERALRRAFAEAVRSAHKQAGREMVAFQLERAKRGE